MTSVTIRLDKDLEERLAEEAAQTGLRRSDIVKMAVQRWLSGGKPMTAEERYQRVKHLIGKFDFGPPDLAERHSEYLRGTLPGDQADPA